MTAAEFLQTHVNDFCRQTGERTVSLETMLDLLFEIDEDLTNQVLSTGLTPETVLRPGPVTATL